ncbi:hypothetical protein Syun_028317 [Stephania yunnanensis]|uniref:Small nuclear ribonucleoprotein G n=1 Tax=Stephania yunnanensis TaxID=152371 RepID=A0AAP0HR06_9MAGN
MNHQRLEMAGCGLWMLGFVVIGDGMDGDRGSDTIGEFHLSPVLISCGAHYHILVLCFGKLENFLSLELFFKLNANRVVVGTLRGFDQFMNLVIDNTMEINGNEKNDIGMVVIRGNSVVMIEALEPVARSQ